MYSAVAAHIPPHQPHTESQFSSHFSDTADHTPKSPNMLSATPQPISHRFSQLCRPHFLTFNQPTTCPKPPNLQRPILQRACPQTIFPSKTPNPHLLHQPGFVVWRESLRPQDPRACPSGTPETLYEFCMHACKMHACMHACMYVCVYEYSLLPAPKAEGLGGPPLNSTPCTLNPKPETPNPKPQTLKPCYKEHSPTPDLVSKTILSPSVSSEPEALSPKPLEP